MILGVFIQTVVLIILTARTNWGAEVFKTFGLDKNLFVSCST